MKRWMTLTELAPLFCRNPSTISRKCAENGIVARADGLYSRSAVSRIMHQAAAAKAGRDKKTMLECDILQARLDTIGREVVTVNEHRADVVYLIGLFREGLDSVENGMKAVTGDAALLMHTEHIITNTKRLLNERESVIMGTSSP